MSKCRLEAVEKRDESFFYGIPNCVQKAGAMPGYSHTGSVAGRFAIIAAVVLAA